MQINIREFSFLNDLWDRIDIIEVEERKMKKLVLTMLSIAGMMLFTALPAKACTSYYVGKDCTKTEQRCMDEQRIFPPVRTKFIK